MGRDPIKRRGLPRRGRNVYWRCGAGCATAQTRQEAELAVDRDALKNHPGRNPDFERGMAARREAQEYNKWAKMHNTRASVLGTRDFVRLVPVPRQPNKYVPHQGRKEMARHGK